MNLVMVTHKNKQFQKLRHHIHMSVDANQRNLTSIFLLWNEVYFGFHFRLVCKYRFRR